MFFLRHFGLASLCCPDPSFISGFLSFGKIHVKFVFGSITLYLVLRACSRRAMSLPQPVFMFWLTLLQPVRCFCSAAFLMSFLFFSLFCRTLSSKKLFDVSVSKIIVRGLPLRICFNDCFAGYSCNAFGTSSLF